MAKRIIALAISFILLTAGAFAAEAQADAENAGAGEEEAVTLELNAKSVLLMEAQTGRVLYEQNPHERLAPASVTKVMTLLLAMEALDEGRIKLSDEATCSEHAASLGGSQIYLEPGEVMTVVDLLKAIAVASANDASVMLAEHIAGSEEGFVEMMNARAKKLGMKNTTFVNSYGLEDPDHRTTAYDVALMSRELLKHEKVFDYTKIWMDTLRDGKFGLANTNKLVRFYNGCTGLKTGSTGAALYCISATALRDNMHLIAVVMGSPTSAERFSAATKLLDYGFANYAMAHPKLPELPKIKVLKGIADSVSLKAEGDGAVLLEKSKARDIEARLSLPESLQAPVEKGQKVGAVIFEVDGEQVASLTLRAAESVRRAGFFDMLRRLLRRLLI